MKLPRTPLKRAGALAAAAVTASALIALVVSTQAGAHPGPVDTSGGHYCTAAQNASGLCAPPAYHRHEANGGIRVVTAPPEAAQLTGQQAPDATTAQPFTPGDASTTTTAPPAAAPTAAPAPLPNTGPIDLKIAVFGFLLSALGAGAVIANRRIPLPVILEFDRARSS